VVALQTPTPLPTGQFLTPLATPCSTFQYLNPGLAAFPDFVAGQVMSEALTADAKTLALLTSGYNNNYDNTGALVPAGSYEYVFLFDVSGSAPVQKQVLQIADTYQGIAFSPDGGKLIVSGGGDDNLHIFAKGASGFAEAAGSPIALGHHAGPSTAPVPASMKPANGLAQGPLAQGVAVTADGNFAVVANRYNDSITVVNLATSAVASDLDLRPGKNGGAAGTPGGEYPNSIAIVGSATAYVSSERDREIVVVSLATPTAPAIVTRIPVTGIPNKMVLDKAQATLYVAEDNADEVSVISVATSKVTGTIPTVAPVGTWVAGRRYGGASPNAVAVSPDQKKLFVSNRGTNSIAVVDLTLARPAVTGLLPTAWYPSDVAVSADGNTLYVVNLKSIPGPNSGNCLGYQTSPCPVAKTPVSFVQNQYIENLNKGGFATLPLPVDQPIRQQLTDLVASNNGFGYSPGQTDTATMAVLKANIQHVIYVVKENRTYDQVLGDLGTGNGDPNLTEFPKTTTPNLHAAAKNFVNLDNFYDAGEVSGNGWPWSTSARESDSGAKMLPVNYACSPLGGPSCAQGRGGSYDWEGDNRNINVGYPLPARYGEDPVLAALTSPDGTGANPDPDILPGTANVAAPDGPSGEAGKGYLWSAALRAGLTVRNYGFFIDLTLYHLPDGLPGSIPCHKADSTKTPPVVENCSRHPFAEGKKQAFAANAELSTLTDPYFRGFDDEYPDFYREAEWEREFNGYVTNGNLPSLSLVRLMNDHTGNFGTAIDGINTPDVQVADNDYAVGRLLQAVASSKYASSTLIFIIEDDAQDAPDHVDAHRSVAYLVGPYVKKGAVVSTHYTTVNVLRTITDVLGLDHLGLNDASQGPMTEVFDLTQTTWTFSATPSTLLNGTGIFPPAAAMPGSPRRAAAHPAHDWRYWARKTQGMDFTAEDRVDAASYNRILWEGLMGKKPYPAVRGSTVADKD